MLVFLLLKRTKNGDEWTQYIIEEKPDGDQRKTLV